MQKLHHQLFTGIPDILYTAIYSGGVALTSLIVLIAGCATPSAPIKYGYVFPRQGTAYVYTVHPWMRDAEVRIVQGKRLAWWDRDSLLFNDGRRTKTLEAKPGQIIYFNGLDADGELFLARAWIGPKPTNYNFQSRLPVISRTVVIQPATAPQTQPSTQSHILPQLPH